MVNTERWGDKSTWVSYDSNITWSPATNKENYTFAYGRNGANPPTELPEGEEFDLSCAPWGIGGDSILCKLSYMLPVWDSSKPTAEQKIEVRPVDPDQYGKSKPLILTGNRQCVVPGSVLNYQLGQQGGRIELVDSYKPEFTPTYSPYSDYSFWTQNVITNFNYSKIIIVPYIMTTGDSYTASDIGNDGDFWYWTMDQVLSRWNEIEGKKAIKGLLLNVYVGAAGSRTAQGSKFQFNVPQLYPEVEIIGSNWGTNPKPLVDTTTLISNGWTPTGMWGDTNNKGSLKSNPFTSTRYYNDLTDWKKSLQWWSWHGNPVSYMDDNWTIYQETPVDGRDTVIRPIFNYEGKTAQQVVDYFLKQVALLGFPFVIDPNDVQAVIGEDNSICLPVFDSYGVTTGNYKKGTEVKDLPNYLWGDDVWERNKYNPDHHDKPSPDPNPILPSTPAFTLAGRGTQCYAITPADMTEIFNDIYGRSSGSFDDLMDGLKLFGSDPMGAIISYKWYPFQFNSEQQAAIVLGTTAISDTHVYPVIQNITSSFVKAKGTFWYDRDKNFVESQETTARLFLPFYGFYELPMPQVLSKELEIEFHYNVPDEVGVWIISFGNVIYDYLECDCSIEIPLTGNNARAIRQAKVNAAISIGAQVAGTAATIAMGGAIMKGVAGGMTHLAEGIDVLAEETLGYNLETKAYLGWKGLNSGYAGLVGGKSSIGANALGGAGGIYNTLSQAAQQINHLKVNVPFHGAADATTFLNLPMYPYIQFFQHQLIQGYNESEYKLKVGHACHKYCTITEMPENSLLKATGMANMSSMGMEMAEVQELNQILQTGFYYTSY